MNKKLFKFLSISILLSNAMFPAINAMECNSDAETVDEDHKKIALEDILEYYCNTKYKENCDTHFSNLIDAIDYVISKDNNLQMDKKKRKHFIQYCISLQNFVDNYQTYILKLEDPKYDKLLDMRLELEDLLEHYYYFYAHSDINCDLEFSNLLGALNYVLDEHDEHKDIPSQMNEDYKNFIKYRSCINDFVNKYKSIIEKLNNPKYNKLSNMIDVKYSKISPSPKHPKQILKNQSPFALRKDINGIGGHIVGRNLLDAFNAVSDSCF